MTKAQTYARALFESISEVRPDDHDKVLDNFVNILSRSGDLKILPDIESEYEKLELASKGISQVEVTTAKDLGPQKELIHELNRIIGGKVELKHKIDQNLIGGIVVRAGDTLIDASVKNSLEQLKNNIAKI